MKILINNEEVLCDKNIKISEEMLNTSSTILNNVYPKSWETNHTYTNYYYPKDYSQCLIWSERYRDVSFDGYCKQDGIPTPTNPVPIQTLTGKTSIEIPVGKNLFDKNNYNRAYGYTSGGLTLNGYGVTATNRGFWIKLEPNTKYTLQIGKLNTNTDKIVGFYNQQPTTAGISANSRQVFSAGTSSINYTFTTDSTNIYIHVKFYLSNSLPTYSVDEMIGSVQIEKGNATAYEPYITKSYNLDLGNLELCSYGVKNLWHFVASDWYMNASVSSYEVVNENKLVATNNGNAYANIKFKLNLPDGQYSFSLGDVKHTNSSMTTNRMTVSYYTGSTRTSVQHIDQTTPRTVTISNQTGRQYVLEFWVSYATALSNTATFENIAIVSGGTSYGYFPYNTYYVLNKDTIYNNGDNWYLNKTVGKIELTGTENWTYQSQYPRFVSSYTGDLIATTVNVCSNYYRGGSDTASNNNCVAFWTNGSARQVLIHDERFTTKNDFNNWLKSNKVVLYSQLYTPTTTQITDEKLLQQLKILNHDLLFSGVAKRTGNISLNPYHAHYCDLQILDYKTLLSEGDMLDFVIADKTVEEAIDMVIDAISDYGFIKGNINIPDNFIMGTYNTQEKTAYDVFQYISDITQTKWTTRVINQDTVAIDFYSPYDKAPVGTIESTQQYFKDNNIIDISYNYSTEDYRNKQILTSREVVSSITETFRVYTDGVNQTFDIGLPIGEISSAYIVTPNDFIVCDVITEAELEQGYSGDIIYNPGETTFRTEDKLANGCSITLDINLLVPGRQIAMNENEINRIATQNDRKGIISRYEARDDTTSSVELQRIAQSYIEYKGKAEITLTVKTQNTKLCSIGDIMVYNSSLEALSDTYMCKKIETEMIMTTGDIFYVYEFSNTYNTENAINYFDNQRNKTLGNIADGETITRNLDIEHTLDIVFFDTEVS